MTQASMVSNLVVSINAILPIFILVAVGLFIRQRKLLSPEELIHVNKMVFQVFFFCLMFYNLYITDYSAALRPRLFAFGFFGVLGLFLLSVAAVCLVEKEDYHRGAMVQAIFRSNFVILGVPIIANVFGRDAITVPITMIAIIVPLYNILSVVCLEVFRGGSFHLGKILLGILKNPLIDGMLLAVFCRFLGITCRTSCCAPSPKSPPRRPPSPSSSSVPPPVRGLPGGAVPPTLLHRRPPPRRPCHLPHPRHPLRFPR